MSAPEKKKSFMGEFKTFIARGNVMDMAIGIIIGGAFFFCCEFYHHGIYSVLSGESYQ